MAQEESIKEELQITDCGKEYIESTSMTILPEVCRGDGIASSSDVKDGEKDSEIHGIHKFLEVEIKQELGDEASPSDLQDQGVTDDPLSSPMPPSPIPDTMPVFHTVKVETLSPITVEPDEAMEEGDVEPVVTPGAEEDSDLETDVAGDPLGGKDTRADPLAAAQSHAKDGPHASTEFSENKANDEAIPTTCNALEKDKFFKCDICGEDFKYSMELRAHLTTHNPERSVKCDMCSYSCRFKSDLARHMPTHLRLKPFKCEVCDKEFKRAGALTQHLTCHSTDRRFFCDLCDYTCRFKSNLVQHTLMHTGLKEFRCNQCGKLFTRSGDLSRHLLIHSTDRNSACHVCEKRFKRRSDLVQHLLIHTSVKLFKCEECGSEFKKASYLARHVKRHKTEIRGDVSSLCHTQLSL